MNSLDLLERAVSLASKEFIRGFIIGQVALLLVIIVLARVLFFRTPTPPGVITFQRRTSPAALKKPKTVTDETLMELAERLGMDPTTLPKREPCLWTNSLAATFLLGPLRQMLGEEYVLERLSHLLNESINKSDMVGEFVITRFEPNMNNPLIHWVEASADGEWQIRLEWPEAATLDIDTFIVLHFPPSQPLAQLPCSFSFTIRTISATLHIALDRMEPAEDEMMRISLLPDDFLLDIEIHSMLGHRSKLKDVPKLTEILHSRIQRTLRQHLLHPNRTSINVGRWFKHLSVFNMPFIGKRIDC